MEKDQPVSFHLTTLFISPLIVFLMLMFLFIALLTRQDQMAAMTFMVLCLAGLTKIWSRYGFSNMALDVRPDKTRVFPGESIVFEILAQNAKLLPVWVAVQIEDDTAAGFAVDRKGPETGFLLWYEKIRFGFHLTALTRGCYSMGRVCITVSDLLRFFPRQKIQEDAIDIIVFPNIRPIRPPCLPEKGFFGAPGARSPVQDPVYILGTRDYQSFTPARHIHWKASAKLMRLKEKVCEPSVQEKLMMGLDVNLFESLDESPGFEHMIEAAASLAVHFHGRGYAVGLLTNARIKGAKPGVVPPGRSPETLSGILETLARAEMKPEGLFSELMTRHIKKLAAANLILCTRSDSPASREIARLCAEKRIPLTCIFSAGLEALFLEQPFEQTRDC